MFKKQDALKAKLGQISAKTLSLGGKQLMRNRNEKKIKFEEIFEYPPLSGPKCIRILKIHEGDEMDVMSCELFEVNLEEEPVFDCLSYTWNLDPEWSTWSFKMVEDKAKLEKPILCNGKTLHITMNLYNALTEFRCQKRQSALWADQVCINQLDPEEKIAQLAIMVDVYRSAASVIVWLGKLSSMRNNALDFMEKLPDTASRPIRTKSESSQTALQQESKKFDLKSMKRPLDAIVTFSNSIADQYHWLGAMFILGRQWFSRAWTLQELLLSKSFKFYMGSREVSPKAIVNAALQVIDFYATDPLSTQAGLNVSFLTLRRYIQGRATLFEEREKFQNGKRYTSEEYLAVIRVREVSLMKDKVIAGVALLKSGGPKSVDYRSTTLEIYMAFASECLWPEAGISMLSLVGGTAPVTEGLPSWAPDLNRPLRPEPLRDCGCTVFNAPIRAHDDKSQIDDKELVIQVAQWDVVKEVGESIWSWTRYDDAPYNSEPHFKMRPSGSVANERFGYMFKLLNELGITYGPTGERTTDVFWQTLIGGINTKPGEDFGTWQTRFQHWFAFTLVEIRSNFYLEKKHSGNRLLTAAAPKKWMVPLIADWPKLEERVTSFLDFHDQEFGEIETKGPQMLRNTISRIAKRVWGAETIEQAGAWKGSMAEILSVVRDEEFYEPISVFGEHFETVYDGRRIFTSKNGYLGTGAEEVKADDVICLVAGGSVPYILRPVPHKEAKYTLVGEAYVHGIMNGESFVDAKLDFKSVRIV